MARGQNFAAFSLTEPKVDFRDWGCNGTSHTSRSSSSLIDEIDLSFHETKEDQSLLTASWAMMQREPGMIPASYDPSSYALSNSISGLNWSVEDKLSALLDDKLCLSNWSDAKAGSMSHPCNNYLSSLSGTECETTGSILPDVDDLLSNAALDVDSTIMDSYSEENEELDLFSSGGGLELENDCQGANSWLKKNAESLTGIGVGDYPYYEHPSRTLFVRNINSSVDDAELRVLFEQFGDIRTLYTACKHRGFVIISYYDIRAARNAMRALQNKSLRRRKLDIHFSIPKENSSEKDVNQGTLVVFNLDASISNDELRQMFGVYGEVKEIRETPHKRHHKFIEFYDVRSAEAALRALNRCDIAGKRIKVEPSRPGGARRSLMQNLPPLDSEQEKNILKEPSGAFFQKSVPVKFATSDACFIERDSVHEACQPKLIGHGWHPLAPLVPPSAISEQIMGTEPGCFSASAASISAIKNPMCSDHLIKMGIKCFNRSSSLESASGDGILTDSLHPRSMDNLPANSFLTSSWNALYQKENFSILLSHLPARSPCGMNRFVSHDEIKPYPPFPAAPILPPNHCHVGSAPVAAFPFLDRNHVYIGESLDSVTAAGSLDGGPGISARHFLERSPSSNHSPGALMSSGLMTQGPCSGAWSILQQQKAYSNSLTRTVHDLFASHSDRSMERGRGRKTDNGVSHYDKKQYELDIELISRGEDLRTTLMIKNIPNKYTSKMLLAAIDENHRGTYDFIYLPIDFKNKCNVGYAFINMTEPSKIIPFYKAFNGKRWEKFNSEKVASLAYARIQGKAALIAHFQNSSLMNEDKRCRPILFHSEGPNVGGQEPFPIGTNPRIRLSKGRSSYHGSFSGRY